MKAVPKIAFTSTSWYYQQISRWWELLWLSDAVRPIVTRRPLQLISSGGTGIDSDAGIKMALMTFLFVINNVGISQEKLVADEKWARLM